MLKYCCVLFSLILTFAADAEVKKRSDCRQDKFCVYSEQEETQVKLYLENKMYYPMTVRFKLTLKNTEVFEHRPLVDTYAGKSYSHVLTLRAKDNKKNWSWKYKNFWHRGRLNVTHDANYVYRLPYQTGRRFKLTQGFNGKYTHKKDNLYGLDFEMPEGTKIYAAREGTVVGIKEDSNKGCGQATCRNDGNYVAIRHSDGTLGEYFHLKFNGVLVEHGQKIEKGQLIGLSGNTGWTTKAHLHFSVHSGSAGDYRLSHPFLIKTNVGILKHLQEGQFYIAVK